MLVLTRKAGQSIRIGDSIVIKIFSVDGSQVKIGIEAPKGVAIFREELYEKLRESNIEALKTARELKIEELLSEKSSLGHVSQDDKDKSHSERSEEFQ